MVIPQSYFLPKTSPVVTATELTKLIYKANKEKELEARQSSSANKKKSKKDEKAAAEEEQKKEEELEAEINKYSTHPAVKERRKAVEKELKDETVKPGKTYIVGESEFLRIRKIARYENASLYLQNREYEEALYNTYLLMQENPSSVYLRKCIVKSLYGLTKYASSTRFDEVHQNHEYIVGNSQQVNYFVDKISASELNVLALSHAWQLKKDLPQDDEVQAMVTDLFAELIDNYYPRRTFFSTTPRSDGSVDRNKVGPEGSVAPEHDTIPAPKKRFSKRKKTTAKRKKNKFNKASDMNQYAFVDFLQDPEFVKMYDDEIKASKLRKKEDRRAKSSSYKREQAIIETHNTINGDALGLDKVVIINPFYYKINMSKKKSLRYVASEEAQKRLNAKIKENATLAGLEFDIIDKKTLAESGTQGYNENAVLNAFIDEMAEHGDIHFVNYMDEDMQELAAKYGTNNFVWTGFISVKQKNTGIILKILAGVVYPIFAPALALDIATPDYDTYFYSIVIDVKTGKKLKTTFHNLGIRDRNDVLDGTLYDLYSQYKNKREPEPAKK